jgi:hypothetical protein
MKQLDWLYFLFWMVGILYISCLQVKIKEVIETTYWIRMHFKYCGKCVGYTKNSITQKLKNTLIVTFDFIITYGILYLIII